MYLGYLPVSAPGKGSDRDRNRNVKERRGDRKKKKQCKCVITQNGIKDKGGWDGPSEIGMGYVNAKRRKEGKE